VVVKPNCKVLLTAPPRSPNIGNRHFCCTPERGGGGGGGPLGLNLAIKQTNQPARTSSEPEKMDLNF